MTGNKDKCINPWFGLLIIFVVCVVIAGAIFFEFKGTARRGKARLKAKPEKSAVQVAFPNTVSDATDNKLMF